MEYQRLKSSYGLGYKPYYWRSRLSLEEVQRRLDKNYGGKLTIVKYTRKKDKGILHCKECGTFETKHSIGSYIDMSGYHKKDCEKCMYKERMNVYTTILKNTSLVPIHYYTKNDITSVDLYCKVCKKNHTIQTSALHSSLECKFCNYDKKTEEYSDLLSTMNCTYISRYSPKNNRIHITFKCDVCGSVYTKQAGDLKVAKYFCDLCSPLSRDNIKISSNKETDYIANQSGKVLINYNNKRDLNVVHLFCGEEVNTSKTNIVRSSLCKSCKNALSFGKPKEYNKHLVQEYLTILYNVKALKDFLVEHNQLDKLPPSPAKIMLEHIDGWINNYEEIVSRHPNGDLGTVVENNPLYLKCKEIFYPIMRKYNLEVKE